MNFNLTFVGQIIVFLILLWFFRKFITPVLAAAIDERQKKIAEGLSAADRGQKSLDEAQARADEVIREARDRARFTATLRPYPWRPDLPSGRLPDHA